MTNEEALRKIQKCFALANSNDPTVVETALKQAQKLMEIHGIDATTIKLSEVGEVMLKSKASVSKMKDWELRLVGIIARAFGCRVLWSKSRSSRKDYFGQFTLVGLKSQLELAEYTCIVMQNKLMKARNSFVSSLPAAMERKRKTIEADGFCHGWIATVSKTINDFALSEEHNQLLSKYVAGISSGNQAKTQHRTCGAMGFSAGEEAGVGESIYKPVKTSRNNTKLLK
jgi:hypothetical protein